MRKILGLYSCGVAAKYANNIKVASNSVFTTPSQHPYSVHMPLPKRIYHVHDASTTRNKLLQRVHGAYGTHTARIQRSHNHHGV